MRPEDLAAALDGRPTGSGYACHCPAHADHNASLSVCQASDGKVLVKCHAGCSQDAVIDALRERGLWPTAEGDGGISGGQGRLGVKGLSLVDLAAAKYLPAESLTAHGVHNGRWGRLPAVVIPYIGLDGQEIARRYRIALAGDRFRWRKGDHPCLYGLSRQAEAREAGWVLLVEGESDCWTAWHHRLPGLWVARQGRLAERVGQAV